MIPTQPTQNIATYASEAPAEMLIPPGGDPVPQQEYQEGVRPLDTLPAAWWNWLWQKFSREEQNIVSVLNSFHSELVNLLTEGGITTPSASSVTQIAEAVKNIHERLATTTTAGSIKSDTSTFGAINVDGTTGIAKMNGAGNGVLDTTPQNLTDAINELVSRVAALEDAPAAESIAPGIMTEFAGEFGPNYTGPGTDYSNVPSGWLACDGRALSRTTYAGLFAKIGTKWGAGDGSTTFNIPDMRDRCAAGASSTVPLGTYQADATAVKGLSCKMNRDDRRVWAGRYWFSADITPGDDYGFYGKQIPSAQGRGGYIGAATEPTGRLDLPLPLSSTDSETRMKNGRVNYIIKF